MSGFPGNGALVDCVEAKHTSGSNKVIMPIKNSHITGDLYSDRLQMAGQRGGIPAFRTPIGTRSPIQLLLCKIYLLSGTLTSGVGILA